MSSAPTSAGSPVRRRFQAGGTVRENALYVERPADRELPEALKEGELCFVLATRQIGKSSLRLRAAKKLEAEGFLCVHIDLTMLGTGTATPETWYLGMAAEIAEQLDLPRPDDFWETNKTLGPVHRWSRYLDDAVLGAVDRPVVVFVDEIDATLSLPFSRDDFFVAVRALHLRQMERGKGARLTFCLLGVAAPWDLVADPTRTTLNVGRMIRLEDFVREEVSLLREGFEGVVEEPDRLLDDIFEWTSGHPYMTQRLCGDLVAMPEGKAVNDAVFARFLEQGRTGDSNLQYAARCFDDGRRGAKAQQTPRLLRLYQRLLDGKEVLAQGSDPVHLALRLTGMAAEREDRGKRVLTVRNLIFRVVFDQRWVRAMEADRAIVEPLTRWLTSDRKEDFLLRGEALAEVAAWAQGREDLTVEEQEFLHESTRGEERREAEEDKRRALRRLNGLLVGVLALLVAVLAVTLWQANRAKTAEADATAQAKQAELSAAVSNSRRLAALATVAGTSGLPQLRMLLAVETVGTQGALIVPTAPTLLAAINVVEHRVLAGHRQPVTVVTISDDGATILTASTDKTARIWPADGEGNPIVLSGHEGPITSAAFGPDGAHVLTASDDRTARVWSADGHGDPIVLSGHEGALTSAAFSPDGSHILTTSDDRTARIWRADGHGDAIVLRHPEGRIVTAAWSPDGAQILTASDDKTARIWRADGRAGAIVLRGHDGPVNSAAWSPDGARVVTASDDETARVWHADGRGVPIVLYGHEGRITSAVWSPDGLRILTASDDETARIFPADGQGERVVLRHPQGKVVGAAWSPDGSRVLTASDDKIARIWHHPNWRDHIVLAGHEGRINGAVWSPGGSYVLTASSDWTARVWQANGVVWRDNLAFAFDRMFSEDEKHPFTDKTTAIGAIIDLMRQHACSYAGRNLTRDEWSAFMPRTEYRKSCPEWPLEP